MRVLAVDPGFDRVGIAVLEKDASRERVVFSECFVTDRKDAFHERLAAVGERIADVIKKHKPDALAIETLFFSTNVKTAMRVAEARGAIIYQAALLGLTVAEYSPQDVKIAVTGYGKATKEQVMDMTRRLLSMSSGKKIDDEMDALALGIAHLAMYRSKAQQSRA
jgi:crossover junction endodeoxyribonuclease RuvC